jgi:hypothetical protein
LRSVQSLPGVAASDDFEYPARPGVARCECHSQSRRSCSSASRTYPVVTTDESRSVGVSATMPRMLDGCACAMSASSSSDAIESASEDSRLPRSASARWPGRLRLGALGGRFATVSRSSGPSRPHQRRRPDPLPFVVRFPHRARGAKRAPPEHRGRLGARPRARSRRSCCARASAGRSSSRRVPIGSPRVPDGRRSRKLGFGTIRLAAKLIHRALAARDIQP